MGFGAEPQEKISVSLIYDIESEDEVVSDKKTAVIIGAGPAGLTAAYYLLQETDIHPIILEQENFVGGISRTADFNGNRMDIGGHRFFSKSEEVTRLWQKLLPLQGVPSIDDLAEGREPILAAGGPDPSVTDEVFLNRRRVSRIFYRRKFFDYPVSLSLSTLKNLGWGNVAAIGFSFIKAKLAPRDEKSLADFMINRFGERLYATFFRDYTTKVWGRTPREIGADWGRQRIRGLSLSEAVVDFFRKHFFKQAAAETSLIDNFYYPKKGPGQLWEKMQREVTDLGGEIRLNSKVTELKVENNRLTLVRFTDGGNGKTREIKSDYVLSSMAIADLAGAMGEDAFSPEAYKAALDLPYRDFITVGILVDRLKITEDSGRRLVPDCWIYIQEPDVKLGRLQIFNNWSPYMVRDPQNTVWLGLEYFCREGDELWSLDDEAMNKLAAEELAKIGIIEKDAVREAHTLRVHKAYPAYFDSYRDFAKIRADLDRIDNLYCIGRNGQHRYNNMDHSMLTAKQAVRAIIGQATKQEIWEVNSEQNYHEAGKVRK